MKKLFVLASLIALLILAGCTEPSIPSESDPNSDENLNADSDSDANEEADNCAEVTCDDYCDGNARYHDAYCDDGECVMYVATVCPFGCHQNGSTKCKEPPVGVIFISSEKWFGNLDGLSGADSKCQNAANNAEHTGTWKALISTSTVNAKDRIPDTVFYLIDGTIIANSKADLFDGTIQNQLELDEYGFSQYPAPVFTGTDDDGTVKEDQGITKTCGDWTVASGDGGIGVGTTNTTSWIDSGYFNSCGHEQRSLYCVRTA
ncbi:MAG: DUF1554 domain-containing protein [Candidatus Diapherotrites archaeon]